MSERLYRSLPAIHRQRDQEQGEPLRALLAVLEAELEALEGNIEELYDDSFIETCRDWVVPYLGDLAGVEALGPRPHALAHPRAQVADALDLRRRKGTALALERTSHDRVGWPARVVELFEFLAHTQHIQFPRPAQGGTFDVAAGTDPALPGRDPFAPAEVFHSADIRRAATGPRRFDIPNLALFLWRLKAFAIGDAPAAAAFDAAGAAIPGGFRFDPLGRDLELFQAPEIDFELVRQAAEEDLPVALGILSLDADLQRFRRRYGALDPAVRPADSGFYGPGTALEVRAGSPPAGVAPVEVVARSLDAWGDAGLMSADLTAFPALKRPRLVVDLSPAAGPADPRTVELSDLPADLGDAAALLEAAIRAASTPGDSFEAARVAAVEDRLLILPGDPTHTAGAAPLADPDDTTTAGDLALTAGAGAAAVTGLVSGNLGTFPVLQRPELAVTLGATAGTVTLADLPADLDEAEDLIETAIRAASTPGDSFENAQVARLDDRLLVVPGLAVGPVTVAATAADTTTAVELKLDTGEEISGLLGDEPAPFPLAAGGVPRVRVTLGGTTVETNLSRPGNLEEARAFLETAIRLAHPDPAFTGARVVRVGTRLLVLPGVDNTAVTIANAIEGTAVTSTTTADNLGFTGPAAGTAPLWRGQPVDEFPILAIAPRASVTVEQLDAAGAVIGSAAATAVLSRVPGDLEEARLLLEDAVRRAADHPAVAGTALAAAFRETRVTALAGGQQLLLLPGGTATRMPPLTDTGSVTTATDLLLTAAAGATATGGLLSGPLAPFPRLAAAPALAVTLGGEGPHRLVLTSVPTDADSLRRELELALRSAGPGASFRDARVAVVESRVVVVPGVPGDRVVFSAPADDPATVAALGLDAVSAAALPAAVSGVLDPFPELRRPRLEAAVGGSVRRTVAFADLPADLGGAALLLEDALRQAHTTPTFRGARVRALAASNTLLVLPGDPDDPIAFFAAGDDATTVDELALGAGGSTALTGLLSGDLSSFPALPASGILDATIGAVGPVSVTLPGVPNDPPADLAEAAAQLQTALNGADPSPEFSAARVVTVGGRLLVLPGVAGADVTVEPAAADPDTALLLQLDRSAAVPTEALESGDLSVFPAPLAVAPRLALDLGGDAAEAVLIRVPRTLEAARAELEAAIRLALPAAADARFTAAQVLTVGGRLVILAGVAGLAVQVLASAGAGTTLDTTTAGLLDLAWRLAVDPSRGRFLFAAGQQPGAGDQVRVDHAYGFAAEIGGGPYDRRATLADETAAEVFVEVTKTGPTALQDAVDQWAAATGDGVIRILDNEVYEEALQVALPAGRRLVIEAADGRRPVLAPEPGAVPSTGPITLTGIPGGSGGEIGELVLNGLLVDLPVELVDNLRLVVLHSTLAPRPGRASLRHGISAGGDASELEVRIASSITGPLPLPSELASLCVEDSILDAQGAGSGAAALPVLVSDRLGDTLRLSASLEMEVTLGTLTRTVRLADVPAGLESARQLLEDALHAADPDPSFAGAAVVVVGDRLLVRSGDPADAVVFAVTGTDARTVAELELLTPPAAPVEGLFSGGLDPFSPFTLPRLAVTVGDDGPRVAELSGFPADPADAADRLEAAIAAVPASAAFTGTTVTLLETTDPAVPIPESRLLVQPGEDGARVRFARTTADAATLAELELAEPPARAVHGLLGDVLDPAGFKGPEIEVTIGAAGPLTVNLAGLPETLEEAAPFLDGALDAAFPGNEPDVLLLGERLLLRPATANEAVSVTSTGLTETSPATLLGLAEPPAESIVGGLLSGVHTSFAGLTPPQIDLTLDDGATVHRATLPEIPGDLAQAAEALQAALRAAAPGEPRLAAADVLVLDDRLLLLAGGAELDVVPAAPEDPDTAGELALVEPPAEDLQGLLSGPVSEVPDFPRPRLEVTLDAAGPQTVTLGELPASADAARSALEAAIRDTGSRPAFVDARVGLVGGDRLLVISGDPSQPVTVEAQIDDGTDPAEDTTTAEDLALVRPPAERVRGLLSGSLLPFPDLGRLHIEATVGGVGPLTVPLDGPVATLAEVAQSLSDGFEAAQPGVASAEVVQDRLLVRPVSFGAAVTLAAPSRDPDTLGDLQLTTPPAVTVQGLLSGSLAPLPTFPQPELQITLGAAAAVTATLANLPTTLTGAGGAAESLETAIRAAGTGPTFTSATVTAVGDRLFVAPGVAEDSVLVEALPADDPGTAEDLALLTPTAEAGLLSGDLAGFTGLQDPEVAVSLGGGAASTAVLTALPADLTEARQLLEAAIQTATGTTARVEISGSRLLVLPATETDTVTVSATAADTTTAGELLLDGGGTAVTGAYSGVLNPFPAITDPPHLDITLGGATQADVALGTPITSLAEAAASLEAAIQGADPADPNFAQARVLAVGDRLLVLPGTAGAAVSFAAAASNAATVTELALDSLTATQGLLSGDLSAFPSPLAAAPGVEATLGGITLTADFDHVPIDLADAATTLQDALVAAGTNDPGTPATFTGATVVVRDTRLLVQPGVAGDSVAMADLAGRPATATDLALTPAAGGGEGLLSGDLAGFTGLRVAPTLDVDLDGMTTTLTFTAIPTDLAGAQSELQTALDAEAVAAQVTVVDDTFLLVNPTDPTLPISFQDPADATRTQTATLLELIAVADGGSAVAVDGLLSGSLTASPVLEAPPPALLDVTIGTDGPRTVDLGVLPLDLAEAASVLEAGLRAVTTSTGFTGARVAALGDDRLFLLPGIADATVVVEANAANPTLAADLQLDAARSELVRALLGGVLADPLELRIAPAMEVTFAADGPHRAVFTTFPETLEELRLELERALAAADPDPPDIAFTGVSVRRLGDRFLVTPGADPTNTIVFTDPAVGTPAASVLALTSTQSRRGEGLLSGSLASFPTLSVTPQMEVTLESPAGTAVTQATVRLADLPADLDAARALLEAALRDPVAVSLGTAAAFAATEVRLLGDRLLVVPGGGGGTSVAAVVFAESPGGPDTAAELELVAAAGVTGAVRGDGLLSGDLSAYSGLGDQFLSFEVTLGGAGPFAVSLASAPADATEAAPLLEAAIRAAHFTPAFSFARVEVLVGDRLLVTPGTAGTEVILGPVTDDPDTVAALGFGETKAPLPILLGSVLSGDLSGFAARSQPEVLATLGGVGPFEVPLAFLPTTLAEAADALEQGLRGASAAAGDAFDLAVVEVVAGRLLVRSPGVAGSAISFAETPEDAVTVLRLRLDAAQATVADGLLSGDLSVFPVFTASPRLLARIGEEGPFPVTLGSLPGTPAAARASLEEALRQAHNSVAFARARVALAADGSFGRLLVVPGTAAEVSLEPHPADPFTVRELGFTGGGVRRVEALVSGALAAELTFPPVPPEPQAQVVISTAAAGADERTATFPDLTGDLDLAAVAAGLQAGVRAAGTSPDAFAEALVAVAGGDRLVVTPGLDGASVGLGEVAGGDLLDRLALALVQAVGTARTGDETGPPLSLERVTVFGRLSVRELELASEVLFTEPVLVRRLETGCVRYSYLSEGSQTARRFRSQPDLALERALEAVTVPRRDLEAAARKLGFPSLDVLTPAERRELEEQELSRALTRERARVLARLVPRFTSTRWGDPGYAQLTGATAREVAAGAENGSEMGAFHQLEAPRRRALLSTLIDAFLRFGLEAGVFPVT